MSSLRAGGEAQAEFLQGEIISDFLARTPAEGLINDPLLSWSTPVCRWVTRHLCTGVFCGPGTTRDPTRCPINQP
jgi:hypothetical protein